MAVVVLALVQIYKREHTNKHQFGFRASSDGFRTPQSSVYKWRISVVVFAEGKQRHYNGQISTKSGKVTIYHNSLIRVNEAPLIVH